DFCTSPKRKRIKTALRFGDSMASEPPFAEPADNQGIKPYPADVPRPTALSPERLEGIVEPGKLPQGPIGSAFPYPWARPPAPPQPGFWLGALLTLGMFLVCQIAIPVGLVVVLVLVRSVAEPDLLRMLGTKGGLKQFQSDTAMLLLVSAHVPMIL